jgi:hypothetical protein
VVGTTVNIAKNSVLEKWISSENKAKGLHEGHVDYGRSRDPVSKTSAWEGSMGFSLVILSRIWFLGCNVRYGKVIWIEVLNIAINVG